MNKMPVLNLQNVYNNFKYGWTLARLHCSILYLIVINWQLGVKMALLALSVIKSTKMGTKSMKKILFVLFVIPSFVGFAQNSDYSINSYLDEGMKAPNTHYIGEAWLNGLVRADENINYNITKATFRANSTLDWHKHSSPQVLIIVEGEGYYQERGKEPIVMKLGDVIKCDLDTEHWHSSSRDHDVTYLAIYSGGTTWTEVLSQAYYDSVAEKLRGQ